MCNADRERSQELGSQECAASNYALGCCMTPTRSAAIEARDSLGSRPFASRATSRARGNTYRSLTTARRPRSETRMFYRATASSRAGVSVAGNNENQDGECPSRPRQSALDSEGDGTTQQRSPHSACSPLQVRTPLLQPYLKHYLRRPRLQTTLPFRSNLAFSPTNSVTLLSPTWQVSTIVCAEYAHRRAIFRSMR
jgi:hypothetical protein